VLLGVAALAAATPPPPDGAPTIRWTREDPKAAVEVVGLDPATLAALGKAEWGPDRWATFLAVTVEDGAAGPAGRPPLLGTYRVEADVVRFVPRFPLERGLRYRAEFGPARLLAALDPSKSAGSGPAGDRPLVATIALRKPPAEAQVVVAQVQPEASTLPENLLKFYIHFSAPMSRGDAYQYLHLLDERGREVRAPFLELGEELWDPSGTRFTLFLDPGRIKRGLRPREEMGPILQQGRSYTLVIDRAWPDAEGRPLRDSYRKPFRAGPPDERPPDPASWTIAPPAAGTADPLVLTFPEPLDHALLHRLIAVAGPGGEAVRGRVAVEQAGTRWRFTPERPWAAGDHRIVIDTALEDLAGNSVGRPFEVDVFDTITRQAKAEHVSLSFRPKGGR
jgi:hypothetical protein